MRINICMYIYIYERIDKIGQLQWSNVFRTSFQTYCLIARSCGSCHVHLKFWISTELFIKKKSVATKTNLGKKKEYSHKTDNVMKHLINFSYQNENLGASLHFYNFFPFSVLSVILSILIFLAYLLLYLLKCSIYRH